MILASLWMVDVSRSRKRDSGRALPPPARGGCGCTAVASLYRRLCPSRTVHRSRVASLLCWCSRQSCRSAAHSAWWQKSQSSKARLAARSCDPSRLQCADASHRGRGCGPCRCAGTCVGQWRSAHTCQQTLQVAIRRAVSSAACFSEHMHLSLLLHVSAHSRSSAVLFLPRAFLPPASS